LNLIRISLLQNVFNTKANLLSTGELSDEELAAAVDETVEILIQAIKDEYQIKNELLKMKVYEVIDNGDDASTVRDFDVTLDTTNGTWHLDPKHIEGLKNGNKVHLEQLTSYSLDSLQHDMVSGVVVVNDDVPYFFKANDGFFITDLIVNPTDNTVESKINLTDIRVDVTVSPVGITAKELRDILLIETEGLINAGFESMKDINGALSSGNLPDNELLIAYKATLEELLEACDDGYTPRTDFMKKIVEERKLYNER